MTAAHPPATTVARVLVLGASVAIRELGHALRHAGHDVEHADPRHLNGEMNGADLILLDVGMDGARAPALAEIGRRRATFGAPPFVVLAPEITAELALHALRAGALNVLRHPAPLAAVLQALGSAREQGAPTRLVPLEVVEREHILAVLGALDGNKQKAAQLLGVDRKTLYRKLKRYEAEDRRAAPHERQVARSAAHANAAH